MKKRFPEATELHHLREYAIVKGKGEIYNNDVYEYVAWEYNKKEQVLYWLSGKAFVIDDVLVLTRIVDDGPEVIFKDIKAVRKALKKLPDWWEKTKYYCVVIDKFASTPSYCTTGQPMDEKSQDYKRIQDALRRASVLLVPRDPTGSPKGIDKAMAGITDPFSK